MEQLNVVGGFMSLEGIAVSIHLVEDSGQRRIFDRMCRRHERRAVLEGGGFHPRKGRGLLVAVLGAIAIVGLSFGVAAAFGVVRFPGPGPGLGSAVLNLAVTTLIFAVVFLGEEIG